MKNELLRSIARRYGGDVCGNTAKIPTPSNSKKDRGTSITLDLNAPDGLLVHSFNGGDPLAIKDMLRRDGFLPPREQSRSYQAQPHIDVEALVRNAEQAPEIADDWQDKMCWDYPDAQGNILYRKKRVDRAGSKKDFFFEQPDGSNGKGNQPHILYRLPDLVQSDGPVFMAEGERCADKLASWGLIATSSKDLDKCDLSALRARVVVILPDNDEEGARIAEKVTKALSKAGAYPLLVELPDLPEKGDIVDWEGSLEDLGELVKAATARSAPIIQASPFEWRDPASIPPRPWLFGHWLLQGMLACLVAPGGSGKSTFLSALALSIASGEGFLGHEVHGGAKNVWIWNLEDDLDELSRSILATAKHHGLSRDQLADRLFVDSALEGSTLCTATENKDGAKLIQPVYDALREELIRRNIGLLIVDPFVSSHEIDENSNNKVDMVAKEWARVAKAANCCILLAHHTSKAGSGKVDVMSARGAVSLINASRSALVINRLDASDAIKYGIEPHEARRYISVSDDKHNRAPAAKADWFRIASVPLCNGDLQIFGESYGGDSVGVIEPYELTEAVEQLGHDQIEAVQARIAEGPFDRENSQAKNWAGHAVAEVLGLCPRDDRQKITRLINQLVKRGNLKTCEKKDAKGNARKFLEVGKAPAEGGEDAPSIM